MLQAKQGVASGRFNKRASVGSTDAPNRSLDA
jgi:hypothetical protein